MENWPLPQLHFEMWDSVYFDIISLVMSFELCVVQNEEVELTDDGLSFKATGDGSKGNNLYSVQLQFYLPIDPEVRSMSRTSDPIMIARSIIKLC